ncbi:hypothetical protein Aph01nite_61330 [Acrocarpospora phusangensis]|uniref:Uncharacterized protein n=1 Tax=Acrocarpospora phusangensis TaxID=1070424 RepID=A0A919QHR9_9ACTN|nr:hypothetical protein Aph01nite_61330 [Acrocarpospora phusangensis]
MEWASAGRAVSPAADTIEVIAATTSRGYALLGRRDGHTIIKLLGMSVIKDTAQGR